MGRNFGVTSGTSKLLVVCASGNRAHKGSLNATPVNLFFFLASSCRSKHLRASGCYKLFPEFLGYV